MENVKLCLLVLTIDSEIVGDYVDTIENIGQLKFKTGPNCEKTLTKAILTKCDVDSKVIDLNLEQLQNTDWNIEIPDEPRKNIINYYNSSK